jgi:hypothetical protein
MYDHVGLRVKDLNASVEFYSAALRPLGYVLCSQDASGASFGLPNQADLWLYPGNDSAGPSAHIALRASDRNVYAKTTDPGITRHMCSTPTATMSRPSAPNEIGMVAISRALVCTCSTQVTLRLDVAANEIA